MSGPAEAACAVRPAPGMGNPGGRPAKGEGRLTTVDEVLAATASDREACSADVIPKNTATAGGFPSHGDGRRSTFVDGGSGRLRLSQAVLPECPSLGAGLTAQGGSAGPLIDPLLQGRVDGEDLENAEAPGVSGAATLRAFGPPTPTAGPGCKSAGPDSAALRGRTQSGQTRRTNRWATPPQRGCHQKRLYPEVERRSKPRRVIGVQGG